MSELDKIDVSSLSPDEARELFRRLDERSRSASGLVKDQRASRRRRFDTRAHPTAGIQTLADASESATCEATDGEAAYLIELGDCWLESNSKLVESLPRGTVIAVRVPEGDYVLAGNGLVASAMFQERIGNNAVGWVHEVGVPISLGGGLWQLRSEA